MNTFKFTMVITLLLASFIALAKDSETCTSIDTCLNKVSKITNKPYFWSQKRELTEKIKLSPNFKLSPSNADSFISRVLFDNGFTRIKYRDGYQIISARKIRYNSTPVKTIEEVNKLDDLNDYIMVTVPVNHSFEVHSFTKSLRPFLSRYGRILGNPEGKTIILQDTITNSKRLIKLIGEMKRKYTKKEIKRLSKEYGQIKRMKQKIKDYQNQLSSLKK